MIENERVSGDDIRDRLILAEFYKPKKDRKNRKIQLFFINNLTIAHCTHVVFNELSPTTRVVGPSERKTEAEKILVRSCCQGCQVYIFGSKLFFARLGARNV